MVKIAHTMHMITPGGACVIINLVIDLIITLTLNSNPKLKA